MNLPEEFVEYTRKIFGEDRWQCYLSAFAVDAPVSVRVNPFKLEENETLFADEREENVAWCRNAFYLKHRPNFTLDPLLHAGVYYVQEASSMFLDTVLQQFMPDDVENVLDLCAAPGGKSTLLRSAMPVESHLYSNEPDKRRANILMENMQKHGHPLVSVTNNYPADYRKSRLMFDVILADVPCSGEGMFRKDEGAIGEWNTQNVMRCAQLQRSIIEDIWDNLNQGGLLIYSTCTFNLHENEENVKWICETLGAEILTVNVSGEWGITGSLLEGWHQSVYRFIPGTTRGEGLFMAVMRKTSDEVHKGKVDMKALRIMSDGNPHPTVKGKTVIPAHAEALLQNLPAGKYPMVDISYDDAIKYLHHEAIVLPESAPRGFVVVRYNNHPLGFVKNIGNRANNLYPQEWKIRNL